MLCLESKIPSSQELLAEMNKLSQLIPDWNPNFQDVSMEDYVAQDIGSDMLFHNSLLEIHVWEKYEQFKSLTETIQVPYLTFDIHHYVSEDGDTLPWKEEIADLEEVVFQCWAFEKWESFKNKVRDNSYAQQVQWDKDHEKEIKKGLYR